MTEYEIEKEIARLQGQLRAVRNEKYESERLELEAEIVAKLRLKPGTSSPFSCNWTIVDVESPGFVTLEHSIPECGSTSVEICMESISADYVVDVLKAISK